MKLAANNKVNLTQQPQPGERASVRIVLIAVISFLLGIGATAFWFQLAAKRNAGNPGFEANSQPAAGQPDTSARPDVANVPPVSPAAVEEVKQAIPNFASVSVDDGENILRTAALKEFTAAAKEMDAQVKAAQQQVGQAQNGQSAAEQQAALKQLQQTQAAATEKLQQIAARLSAQIVALKSLKNNE